MYIMFMNLYFSLRVIQYVSKASQQRVSEIMSKKLKLLSCDTELYCHKNYQLNPSCLTISTQYQSRKLFKASQICKDVVILGEAKPQYSDYYWGGVSGVHYQTPVSNSPDLESKHLDWGKFKPIYWCRGNSSQPL